MQIVGAQFTSEATAAAIRLQLGFVPDYVEYIENANGTNPNRRFWVNRDQFASIAAGADDSILETGSSGVNTLDTASIAVYNGGDIVTAADVTAGLYRDRQGNVATAGQRSQAGITIPAGDQTNSGVNFVLAVKFLAPKV